jgi:hypothetical protein
MDGRQYFVALDGKQSGPYKGQQIRNKLQQGKLRESDYIWREGMQDWSQIGSMLNELPGAEPPPAPEPDHIRKLTITHPDDFPTTELEVPEKGIYEPPATMSQKNALMKLGCKNPEALRSLGRDQASFMIDAFQRDKQAVVAYEIAKIKRERYRQNLRAWTIFLILVSAAIVAVVLVHLLVSTQK